MATNKQDKSLVLKKATSKFKDPVDLADGPQQFITGTVNTKMGDETATGDLTLKITSSLLSFDEQEFENLLETAKQTLRARLTQWREELDEATKKIQSGKLSLFAPPPAVRAARKKAAPKAKPTSGKAAPKDKSADVPVSLT
jgi:hypothetical protein